MAGNSPYFFSGHGSGCGQAPPADMRLSVDVQSYPASGQKFPSTPASLRYASAEKLSRQKAEMQRQLHKGQRVQPSPRVI